MVGMAEVGAPISLDGVAVHPECWCISLCYLHFAPENPEDGEMCLLVHRLTRVVPDKVLRAVKWLCVCCVHSPGKITPLTTPPRLIVCHHPSHITFCWPLWALLEHFCFVKGIHVVVLDLLAATRHSLLVDCIWKTKSARIYVHSDSAVVLKN